MIEESHGPCRTLADIIMEETRKPQQIVLFTNPIEIRTDPRQLLKDLTAEQTRLFNADAPQDNKIRIYDEIKRVQEQRRKQQ